MASAELMTWVKSRKGWMKKHRGRMYSVSAKQLNCPPSRERSREAANQWWATKLGTLETQPPPKPHEADYKRIIALRRGMAQWFRDHLSQDATNQRGMEQSEAEADRLQLILDNDDNPPALTTDDEPLYAISEGGKRIWADRLKHINKDLCHKDKSIGYWVNRWVENQKARAQSKQISTDRYGSYRYAIEYFGRWAGQTNDIQSIDYDKVEQYYNHLLDLIAQREKDPAKGAVKRLLQSEIRRLAYVHLLA